MVIIYFWLGILILCIIVEAITATLVTIWFIPASLVAMVVSLFNAPIWLQILSFVVTGVVLLVTTKPLFEKVLRSRPIEKTNARALIGKKAIVIEDIDNIEESGAVKLEGKVWTARSEGGEKIKLSEIVEITDIQGVKLICKKITEE